ncbi:MAG: hypothetical protein HRF42_08510 [Candidatus Brocadia sp.]|jgi:hypothetical protein
MTNKINQSTEPAKIPTTHFPQKPLNTWKHLVAHLCIWFFVVVLVMVYFTSTGSPQAGLLEVGASAVIFVVLFHFVMKFFPLITKIITSLIVIGFGIALILVNYHYLKIVKKDASLEQLLVGDLLVHKILKTIKKEPIVLITREEMPKAVIEPPYEMPQPIISLGQLKTTIANPIMADVDLKALHLTTLAPAIKTGAAFIAEKHTIEPSVSSVAEDIANLMIATKECGPIVQTDVGSQDIPFSPPLTFIHETAITQLQIHRIQPPVSEITEPAGITLIKLSKPLKEGRIPID